MRGGRGVVVQQHFDIVRAVYFHGRSEEEEQVGGWGGEEVYWRGGESLSTLIAGG